MYDLVYFDLGVFYFFMLGPFFFYLCYFCMLRSNFFFRCVLGCFPCTNMYANCTYYNMTTRLNFEHD